LLNNTRVSKSYGSFKKHQKRELFFPAFLHNRLAVYESLLILIYNENNFLQSDI